MFNIGGGEFLIIFLVALVVLGPTKLPEAARQAGKVIGEFRRISSGFQREIQSAMNDPVSKVTGISTPRSIKDVTSMAELPPIADGSTSVDEASAKPPVSDPFAGNSTTNLTSAPVAEPATPVVDSVSEEASDQASPEVNDDVQSEDEPPDAPVMYGDR